MAEPVRFLHVADLHLGASFGYLPVELAEAKRQSMRRQLDFLATQAIERELQLCLVAGDVFDSAQPPSVEVQAFKSFVRRLEQAGIGVFIIPGNHDPSGGESVWTREAPWPGYVFLENQWTVVHHQPTDVAIHGIGFAGRVTDQNMLQQWQPSPESTRQIVLLHGAWQNFGRIEQKYYPFSTEDVAACSANYIALGHYHRYAEVVPGKAYYTGSLEGLSFADNETGQRYAILGEIGEKYLNIDQLPLASMSMQRLEWDTTTEIRESLLKLVSDACAPEALLEVNLIGLPSPEVLSVLPELEALIEQQTRFGRLKTQSLIELQTAEVADTTTYEGRFVEALRVQLETAEPAQRAILLEAMAIGLAAFRDRKWTI